MFKFKYLTAINIQKRLNERIKGSIFVTLNDDNIEITIHAGRGILYKRSIDDISDDTNYEWLIDEIEYGYRQYIKERFFYY